MRKKIGLCFLFLLFAVPSFARITTIITFPGGDNGEIQYNNHSRFSGADGVTYSSTTSSLNITSTLSVTGRMGLPNSATLPTADCQDSDDYGRIYIDTNTTSGKQLYVCEGASGWVLQGDGGSGGASTLQIQVGGVEVSSPTASIDFDGDQFIGTESPSEEANISLDPSSVTLQGNNLSDTYLTNSSATATYLQLSSATATYVQTETDPNAILNQDTLQSGATFYVSSGTVDGTLTANQFTDTSLTTDQLLRADSSGNIVSTGTIDLASEVDGNLPVANLNSGTSASGSTFWRGDATWATPAGSGGGGYDVEPATVTFQLDEGVTATTGTFTDSVTVDTGNGVTTIADDVFGPKIYVSTTTGQFNIRVSTALEADSFDKEVTINMIPGATPSMNFFVGDGAAPLSLTETYALINSGRELRLADDNSSFYTAIRASGTLTYNHAYHLPETTGAVNQVLSIKAVHSDHVDLKWKNDTGGSGGSTIWVQDGGSQIVETSTIDFTGAEFIITDNGGEALVKLDPSSVTMQGNNLSDTYLTNSSATATYLQLSSATATYAPISGSANYIQNRDTLQTGSTFYVSSGTVSGPFYIRGVNGTEIREIESASGPPNGRIRQVKVNEFTGGGSYSISVSTRGTISAAGSVGQTDLKLQSPTAAVEGSVTVSVNGETALIITPTLAQFIDTVDSSTVTTNKAILYDGNESNYVAFVASDVVASDVTWVLPAADGSNGQAMTTNGTGDLSFTTISGGSGGYDLEPATVTIQADLGIIGSTATFSTMTVTGELNVQGDINQSIADSLFFDKDGTNLYVINNETAGSKSAFFTVRRNDSTASAGFAFGEVGETDDWDILMAADSDDIRVYNIAGGQTKSFTFEQATGHFGAGTYNPGARIHSVDTATQLRLAYNSTNHSSFTVTSGGDLEIDTTGDNVTFDVSELVTIPNLVVSTLTVTYATITINGQTLYWPNDTGTNDYVLTTDGNSPATLTWEQDNTSAGGASIEVEDGGASVVNTSTLNFTGAEFIITDSGSKALIKLDPSSVTLQGNDLASTYLTNSSATATYLTKSSATLTYPPVGPTIELNEISDPDGNGVISMGAFTQAFNFSNPVGGMTFDFIGAFSGDGIEIKQEIGNPGVTHLLHINAIDVDVVPLHLTPGNNTLEAAEFDGFLIIDDSSLKFGEGVDTMTITVPTLTADRAVTFPDAAGEVSLLGQTIDLSGAEVTGDLPAASIAAGSLGGAVIASSVAASGVTAGTYGDSTNTPQFTVGVDGRITSAANVGISGVATSTFTVAGFSTDGGGSAITSGSTNYLYMPFSATITGWTLLADTTGSIVIDVKKCAGYNCNPTTSIAGSEKPTLSAVWANQDNALSSWTTALTEGDKIAFVIDSAATVTKINLSITGWK